MLRRIVGFHEDTEGAQDAEISWVVELECGHKQHVRHNPPWESRPWVLTEESRRAKLGETLNCVLCRVPFTSTPRS